MSDDRCGSVAGYQAHQTRTEPTCRPCKDAWAEYHHRRKIRVFLARGPLHVDDTGTRRRIHALMWMGWSQQSIATCLGVTPQAVRGWLRGRPVLRSTAERVSDLYDLLWSKPGPSDRTRRFARAHGWAPPLAWDDEGIDLPSARPAHDIQSHDRGKPRDLDLEERVLVLTRAGLSAAEIAVRLRCTTRYVQRVRSRYRREGDAA